MDPVIASFLLFAVAASITPGPNNVLALATAAAHGMRATLPLICGVALGFGTMVALVGLGLGEVLADHPAGRTALRWTGLAWLLLLAWRTARAPVPVAAGGGSRPASRRSSAPGFWQGCGLQWINPKAWILSVATTVTYAAPGMGARTVALAGAFVLVSLPCVGAWAALGAGSARVLGSPRRWRAFNVAMGLLLAAAIVPAALD